MKILHVVPSIAGVRGGPSEAVLEIVKTLDKLSVRTEIATTNDNGDNLLDVPLGRRTNYKGAQVWFFPCFSPFLKPLKEYAFSAQLTKWLWRHIAEYDLVHIHALFSYATTAAMFISRIKNVPYIVRPNGMLCEWSLKRRAFQKNIYLALIERSNINRAHMIEFTSTQEKTEALVLGLSPESFILPYGLHQAPEMPEARKELRKALKIPQDEPVILFLSRLHRKKGLDCLIPALGEIKERRFSFVIAGSGSAEYEAKIDKLLLASGIRNRTYRAGFVHGRKKELLLQGADIFALTSYSESFGLAVLEAMANKLPVVITGNVPLHSEVEEYKAGVVVDCNSKQICAAVLRLLGNENLRRFMGENGKRLAEEEFIWDKVADKLAGIYREIVK